MKAQITLNANFTFTTNGYVPSYVSASLDRATEIFFCVWGGSREAFAVCVTSYLNVVKKCGFSIAYSRKLAALISEGRVILDMNEEAELFAYSRSIEAAQAL